MRGLISFTDSYSSPSLETASGVRLWTNTSADFINCLRISMPFSDFMSRVRLFLLRLSPTKAELRPRAAVSHSLATSPTCGLSIFITSAPKSESSAVHMGPLTLCSTATTFTPSSGRIILFNSNDLGNHARKSGSLLRNRFGFKRITCEFLSSNSPPAARAPQIRPRKTCR